MSAKYCIMIWAVVSFFFETIQFDLYDLTYRIQSTHLQVLLAKQNLISLTIQLLAAAMYLICLKFLPSLIAVCKISLYKTNLILQSRTPASFLLYTAQ